LGKEYEKRRDMNLTLAFFFLGINFTHKHLYIRMKYKRKISENIKGILSVFVGQYWYSKGIFSTMTCKIGAVAASILALTFFLPTYVHASRRSLQPLELLNLSSLRQ
jgi:hypothetical protein